MSAAVKTGGVRLTLDGLRETYTICRLPRDADVPAWAARATDDEGREIEFSSISRTADELSIVRPSRDVPADLTARTDGWRGLKVRGPLDLATSGILLTILLPLGTVQIPGFPVATYETDYLFVREQDRSRAIEVLRSAGHTVND
jgi:hypothetical protein